MHALRSDGVSHWSPRKLTKLSVFGDTEMASIHPENGDSAALKRTKFKDIGFMYTFFYFLAISISSKFQHFWWKLPSVRHLAAVLKQNFYLLFYLPAVNIQGSFSHAWDSEPPRQI